MAPIEVSEIIRTMTNMRCTNQVAQRKQECVAVCCASQGLIAAHVGQVLSVIYL